MSEIATLEKLEIHLSHAPNFRPHTLANRSALESYFSEIRYSSFKAENANSAKAARITYKPRAMRCSGSTMDSLKK
jgi:hypothetical protein